MGEEVEKEEGEGDDRVGVELSYPYTNNSKTCCFFYTICVISNPKNKKFKFLSNPPSFCSYNEFFY